MDEDDRVFEWCYGRAFADMKRTQLQVRSQRLRFTIPPQRAKKVIGTLRLLHARGK
jgi:hypothetical protein